MPGPLGALMPLITRLGGSLLRGIGGNILGSLLPGGGDDKDEAAGPVVSMATTETRTRRAGNSAGAWAEEIHSITRERTTSPASASNHNASALMSLLNSEKSKVNKWLPRFGHAITVNVRGGPEADLRRIWYLALAACFGRYKRGLSGCWGRSLNAQWNITGKEVSVTLAYTFSGLVEVTTGVALDETGLSILQRGPDQVTIGAGFPTWMWTTGQNLGGGVGWVLLPLAANVLGYFSGGGLRAAREQNAQQDTAASKRLADFFTLNRFSITGSTGIVSTTRLTMPWVVESIFGNTAVATRVFQPYRFRPAPDIFRELPGAKRLGTAPKWAETLPVRRIMPGSEEMTTYVYRGGTGGLVPILPDDGRVITTGEKRDPRVQGVKPPVDGIIRCNPIAMITQVLGNPGYVTGVDTYTAQTHGSGGVFVTNPGTVDLSTMKKIGPVQAMDRPDPATLTGQPLRAIQAELDSTQVPQDTTPIFPPG